MINLIPPKHQKELKLELVYRRIVLFLLFIFICLVIEAGVLVYIQRYVAFQNNFFQGKITEKQERLANAQLQVARDTIAQENKTLDKVNRLWKDQILFIPLLEKFYQTIPPDVYLKTINLDRGGFAGAEAKKNSEGSKSVDIAVTGFAKSRESLLIFLDRLKKEPLSADRPDILAFDDINFSSSAWFKPSDIEFSLSLTFLAGE